MEDYDDVHLELDLEPCVLAGGTGVNFWEEHVAWDLGVWDAVTISHLDVLDLGCLSLAFEGLYTYELDFDRLDLQL